MIVKAGEVLCIASGIFENYDRAGPFVATQDFDLDSFIAEAMKPLTEKWEVSSLFGDIPRVFFENGLITKLPCRKIYLGAMGEVDIREEQDDL
ncbi:hypothetical protein [Pseudomonas veronii]|uniref:hypothetical protein n=1 Tax=Pseudomonas veronii TaxID=76761 RepID=UPI00062520E8|nr:hypothetical protein [Pseudomonas veronii]MCT9827092.1 hypothetical protein [Pseudomonas veronii]